jgi:hypothetical protein
MEKVVEQARTRPKHTPKSKGSQKGKARATVELFEEDTFTTSVPNSVLDECERTFIAAQETVVKTSTNSYADTGMMALLCRHDRVLWMANMTSPGERQYYALALIRRLFSHIPDDWTVGVLYDIACQIHRSLLKVGNKSSYSKPNTDFL